MPRTIRNFWITTEIDGRASALVGGPRAKDGGIDISIKQRDAGRITEPVKIDGWVDPEGNITTTVRLAPEFVEVRPGVWQHTTHRDHDASVLRSTPIKTHQIVDFGEGPQDTFDYPFEGTEAECSAWLDENGKDRASDGKNRYGMQEIPPDDHNGNFDN